MQCQSCGTQVTGKFCPQCGAQVAAQGQAPQASPLQPGLGIAALVVSVLSLAIGGFLYVRSTQFEDEWSFEAIRYGDLAWVVLLAGGGLAVALAAAVLFVRGNRRWWAIPGGVVALAAAALGAVLAA